MTVPNDQKGFSLVEVLIGLILLSIISIMLLSVMKYTVEKQLYVETLNKATRLATDQAEVCRDLATRSSFSSITSKSTTTSDNKFTITRTVVNYSMASDGTETVTTATSNLKLVTVTVTSTKLTSISVSRQIKIAALAAQ